MLWIIAIERRVLEAVKLTYEGRPAAPLHGVIKMSKRNLTVPYIGDWTLHILFKFGAFKTWRSATSIRKF